MRRLIQRLVILALFASPSLASYCGKTAVPYSFEVLPNGAPVLGCAQPSCVAAAEEPLVEDSEFLTDVTGQSDGFFRDGDRALKRYRHDNAPKLIANCSGQFNELSCPRKNQFVGGIEYIDHPRQPLILQCCTYDGLRFSQEVGTTTVGPGEAITGGEVVRGGRQISFDVIANVRKIVRSSGSQRVSYEVTVRRMNCLPDPPEPEVSFDQAVPSEVLKVLSSASAKEVGAVGETKQEKKGQKEIKKDRKQFASATEEVSENGIQQPLSSSRNSEISLSPNVEPVMPINQQPIQQPQQQIQQQQSVYNPQSQQVYNPQSQQVYNPQQQFIDPNQQQQQFIDPNQQQQQVLPAETSTVFPTLPTLFPTHTFPTLPPHTFPTHTFPTHTFPTHTFPTLPPHTFPGFTFAPLTATPAPATLPAFNGQAAGSFPNYGGSVPAAQTSGIAFAAPSVTVGPSDPLPTLAPFTPPTFAPFSPLPAFSTPSPLQPPAFGQPQPAQPQGPTNSQQSVYSAASPPNSQAAMGTILQNFQGNYRPIELPGLGVVGYGNK